MEILLPVTLNKIEKIKNYGFPNCQRPKIIENTKVVKLFKDSETWQKFYLINNILETGKIIVKKNCNF